MSLRSSFEFASLGKPSGPLGRIGARLMASMKGKFYRSMAAELELRPDDELLDVGCGSAVLLVEHASHARYVAGLDASVIQVEMARRRLADALGGGPLQCRDLP